MTVVVNLVRSGFYLDSVGLMRLSLVIKGLDGVEDAALMMGTPANREILGTAGLLDDKGRSATSRDLLLAVRATSVESAEMALAQAERQLALPKGKVISPDNGDPAPRSLRSAVRDHRNATLALISVPGPFAGAEALKALNHGLDVMIFSDNVPVGIERHLKEVARDKGRIVMGPDCGTAIIGGVPLAFANTVPRGPIGIIGASGTGIQEVSCLIAKAGSGVSHAIGTGGRDLSDEIGGLTTMAAIGLMNHDSATETVVLISKPPSRAVAYGILERVEKSRKRFVICFLGMDDLIVPENAVVATTLKRAALAALGARSDILGDTPKALPSQHRQILGLFTGGTLCAEAQQVLRDAGHPVASNVPVPSANPLDGAGHKLIDLGADEYTLGRPHPMIEPAVRNDHMAEALARTTVGVILIDLVLGHGSHPDPAASISQLINEAGPRRPLVVASVTGTDADPQGLERQSSTLRAAGVLVAPSNADAAALALACSKTRA